MDPNDATTVGGSGEPPQGSATASLLSLTIAYHLDASRVGERVVVREDAAIARATPSFAMPGEAGGRPLGVANVSRKPMPVRFDGRSAWIAPPEGGAQIRVDGERLEREREIDATALQRGAVVDIAGAVLLVLQSRASDQCEPVADGIVGHSSAVEHMRRQIARVSRHDVPVLLRGESGTGKELVARAIHRASPRSEERFVSVNLAAIPGATAAAALFGHQKGAFTGAVEASHGYFGEAAGGTLFLDEVAEASEEVQAALLRALESGEVQPVGSPATRRVDVRLVAATDADLESHLSDGRFKLPLMMRLSGYELVVSPLRERRDDIPRLLCHFVREELGDGDAARLLLADDPGRAWLPCWVVEKAMEHHWPGNVRELRNFARQLVIDHADTPRIERGALDWFDRRGLIHSETPEAPRPRGQRVLEDIGDDELRDVMVRHRFQPGPAAAELGIARSSLYTLLERHPSLRKASDIGLAEIHRSLEEHRGSVTAAAAALGVSSRALRMQMRALGLTP